MSEIKYPVRSAQDPEGEPDIETMTVIRDATGRDLEPEEIAEALNQAHTVTDAMVDRFLNWPLPTSVCSDPCVARTDYPHSRIGTNLLTAAEARQMLEWVMASPSK